MMRIQERDSLHLQNSTRMYWLFLMASWKLLLVNTITAPSASSVAVGSSALSARMPLLPHRPWPTRAIAVRYLSKSVIFMPDIFSNQQFRLFPVVVIFGFFFFWCSMICKIFNAKMTTKRKENKNETYKKSINEYVFSIVWLNFSQIHRSQKTQQISKYKFSTTVSGFDVFAVCLSFLFSSPICYSLQ